MRKMVMWLVMSIFTVLGVAACGGNGSGSATISQNAEVLSAPAKVEPGRFYIDQKNKTQGVFLGVDESGYLCSEGIGEIGTMKYKPSNVVEVMYISDRQYFSQSLVANESRNEVGATFEDTINNDKPVIILRMDDGEQYPINMKALKFDSAKPIRFYAGEFGFEYGHEEKTEIDVDRNKDNTIDITINFGCDKLVGLINDVDINQVYSVSWETRDGQSFPAFLAKNDFGSYFAKVMGISLTSSMLPYWSNPVLNTTGKLVVVMKDGTRVDFKTWESGYEWEYNYPYPLLNVSHMYDEDRFLITFFVPDQD